MTTTTIKPGILVALRSHVSGGVRYERADLAPSGDEAARWETRKLVDDEAEHERAVKARALAVREVRKECAATSFGLLCGASNEGGLDAAYARARAIVDEFNASARFARISIAMLKGRIASTDEEAARAIGAEVAGLIREMNQGIDKLDPGAIREAASRALQMASVLSEDRQIYVSTAVEAARKAARQIVKRIQKDGEVAAVVLADIQRGAIDKARIAFLDTDEDALQDESDAMPAVDVARVAGLDIDLDDDAAPEPVRAATAAPAFEVDDALLQQTEGRTDGGSAQGECARGAEAT
jgi:hypothetical protein